MKSIVAAFLGLVVLESQAASRQLEVQVSASDEFLYVSVVNRGDYRIYVPQALNSHPDFGNLRFEFKRGERIYTMATGGYPPPALAQDDKVEVPSMHMYGTVFSLEYLLRAYRLQPGCYQVTASYAPSNKEPYVRSSPTKVCIKPPADD